MLSSAPRMKPLPIIVGVIAGLVGAAIWATIAYLAHAEIGIVAWGIGGLVGFCVATAMKGEANQTSGALAAIIAVLAVVGGKYSAVYATTSKAASSIHATVHVTDDDMKVALADTIVEERLAANATLKWPQGKDASNAEAPEDYPRDVWAEASKQWDELTDQERTDRKKEAEAAHHKMIDAIVVGVNRQAFWSTFGVLDIVFFVLAIITAFRLGSGGLN